ncbi:hypothetical protein [Neisseria musculi]|nr:hypothetical protein [Neisseria musculi]
MHHFAVKPSVAGDLVSHMAVVGISLIDHGRNRKTAGRQVESFFETEKFQAQYCKVFLAMAFEAV